MKGATEEALALDYLERQGLRAVARNWRCRGGELDLILNDRGTLVIAEVRKRSRNDFGGAAASVDARKQRRIVHAARLFLARHPQYSDAIVRFDVIALDAENRIEWIQSAFDADG